jgi:tetratricopeptide (TPR) repeat protein
MDMNIAKLSNQIDFTKNVIEAGLSENLVEEGEWFEIEAKLMFDKLVLSTLVHDSDRLIGFNLNNDQLKTVRMRMGYFNSQICKILQTIIRGMRLNEKAQISFELDPDLLDESFREDKQSKKSEKIYLDLKFEIFLKTIEKSAIPVYKLNINHLLAISNEHKLEANELFKCNLILTAFHRYHKAISYLIIAEHSVNEKQKEQKELSEQEEEQDDAVSAIQISKIKSQLYSNLAACQLRGNNYKMAIKNCTKCLEIDKTNVKALFRRSTANTAIKEFELASQDLKQAIQFEPNNIEVKKNLTYVESLQRQYNQVMSNNLKKMFQ